MFIFSVSERSKSVSVFVCLFFGYESVCVCSYSTQRIHSGLNDDDGLTVILFFCWGRVKWRCLPKARLEAGEGWKVFLSSSPRVNQHVGENWLLYIRLE